MALLPSTGFPETILPVATIYPLLPIHSDSKLRQFDPNTLPVGTPGNASYGGRSMVDPTSASHM